MSHRGLPLKMRDAAGIEDHRMTRLSHRQIFLDTARPYFAPLTGAIKGSLREIAIVQRTIDRRKAAQRQSRGSP